MAEGADRFDFQHAKVRGEVIRGSGVQRMTMCSYDVQRLGARMRRVQGATTVEKVLKDHKRIPHDRGRWVDAMRRRQCPSRRDQRGSANVMPVRTQACHKCVLVHRMHGRATNDVRDRLWHLGLDGHCLVARRLRIVSHFYGARGGRAFASLRASLKFGLSARGNMPCLTVHVHVLFPLHVHVHVHVHVLGASRDETKKQARKLKFHNLVNQTPPPSRRGAIKVSSASQVTC